MPKHLLSLCICSAAGKIVVAEVDMQQGILKIGGMEFLAEIIGPGEE